MGTVSCDAPGEKGRPNACRPSLESTRGVDVIICAWNREDTIERAIASALGEPEVRSVVVVDDGSTDGTAKAARAAEDGSSRLKVLQLPRNCGPAAARNRALAAFEDPAPWVTIVDGDDFILPGRFARMLHFAEGWDVIADDLLQVRESDCGIDAGFLTSATQFAPWKCDFKKFVLGNISRKGRERKELGFMKPLISRAFLDKHGLRYQEALRLGEDYALYAQLLALRARFRIIPACGYVSVIRCNSLSSVHSRQDLERLRDFDFVLEAMPGLSASEKAAIRSHQRSVDARVQWLEVIEAVKARSVWRVIRAYARSPEVAAFVSAQLSEQLYERTAKQLRVQWRRNLKSLLGRPAQPLQEATVADAKPRRRFDTLIQETPAPRHPAQEEKERSCENERVPSPFAGERWREGECRA